MTLLFIWLLAGASAGRADTFAYLPKTDGTIARFQADARTGKLALLPGATDTGLHRLVTLTLSADKRFLYAFHQFAADTDGYSLEFETPDHALAKATHTKPTLLAVFAIESGGSLRHVQTLSVPGPVGQVVPHPKGRWVYALTDGGAFLLKTAGKNKGTSAKPLTYVGRVPILSGMGLVNMPGERDAWWLTFSPSGAYLYDFQGDGFVDHAENYLQQYRIDRASGQALPTGKQWSDSNETNHPEKGVPGSVWCVVNRTAFVKGFAEGFYGFPIDAAGRLSPRASRLLLRPNTRGNYYMEQHILPHPALPLVVYRGSFTDPYMIWRVTAPGKVVNVGRFPSAFSSATQSQLAAAPNGRFLYETASPLGWTGAPLSAVHAWAANGTCATLSAAPAPLPFGCAADLTFADVPPTPR